jgi:predicted site-specific integrase-resolvase
MEKLFTQSEVAKMLRVSDGTIENYRKQGLQYIKMSSGKGASKVLFRESDVEDFINERVQNKKRRTLDKALHRNKEWRVS